MADLDVVAIPNGQFAENCYLLGDRPTGRAVLVDPGEESDRFLEELARRAWQLEAIWLTHAHIDHILGVQAVVDAIPVPIHLHPLDRPLYDNVVQQGLWFGLRVAPPPPPDRSLAGGDRLRLGATEFLVRHTPGHSPGSVSFVTDGLVLAGDVLFHGSIGRTDLPGGDFDTLMGSIHRELLALPDATRVLSGHGPETTIGHERRHNPFLQDAVRS